MHTDAVPEYDQDFEIKPEFALINMNTRTIHDFWDNPTLALLLGLSATDVCMCMCLGYGGTSGRYSASHQSAPSYTARHTDSYTGGLTEEEQLDAAIRNSLNERGERGGFR